MGAQFSPLIDAPSVRGIFACHVHFEWVFVSVDHALYNQMNQGRIMPCDACMAAIIEVLGER